MNVVLLRVGIDSGAGGIQSPLYADGGFDLVCIPDNKRADPRTYSSLHLRDGRPWADLFPPARRAAMATRSVHVDPEFETFTYGDPTRPKRGLRKLTPGDLLVFYAGLQGCGFDCPPALYLIGFFHVAAVGFALEFDDNRRAALFANNFHVRHPAVFDQQKHDLLLIKGDPATSRLLSTAVRISTDGRDRNGRPLKVLSTEMRAIFGDFGGKNSFQRSPPRWVSPAFVPQAADYVRSLP